jgi:twitching motility protein PilU
MINSPLIKDLIFKGKVHEIKEIMQKSKEAGMQTFDMALFDLYESGTITYEDAMRAADSMNELRLRIKLEGKDANQRDAFGDVDGLSIVGDDDGIAVPIDFDDAVSGQGFELDGDELDIGGSSASQRA